MWSIENLFDKSCLRSFKQKDFCVKAHFSHLQRLQEIEHADWREGRREHVSRTGQQVNGLLLSLIRWNLRRWASRQGSTRRGAERGKEFCTEDRNKKHWQSLSFQSSRSVDISIQVLFFTKPKAVRTIQWHCGKLQGCFSDKAVVWHHCQRHRGSARLVTDMPFYGWLQQSGHLSNGAEINPNSQSSQIQVYSETNPFNLTSHSWSTVATNLNSVDHGVNSIFCDVIQAQLKGCHHHPGFQLAPCGQQQSVGTESQLFLLAPHLSWAKRLSRAQRVLRLETMLKAHGRHLQYVFKCHQP